MTLFGIGQGRLRMKLSRIKGYKSWSFEISNMDRTIRRLLWQIATQPTYTYPSYILFYKYMLFKSVYVLLTDYFLRSDKYEYFFFMGYKHYRVSGWRYKYFIITGVIYDFWCEYSLFKFISIHHIAYYIIHIYIYSLFCFLFLI